MNVAIFAIKDQIETRKSAIAEARRIIGNLDKQIPIWREKIVTLEAEIAELKADLKKIDPEELRNIA